LERDCRIKGCKRRTNCKLIPPKPEPKGSYDLFIWFLSVFIFIIVLVIVIWYCKRKSKRRQMLASNQHVYHEKDAVPEQSSTGLLNSSEVNFIMKLNK